MHVLITGGGGQLAADLHLAFQDKDVTRLRREELDVTKPEQVHTAFDRYAPDVVLNTAAWVRLDECEADPESAFAVNATAPLCLADACSPNGALLVHFSSDYVFTGNRTHPYREEDPVGPLSTYGASKVAGEMAVRATTDRHLIVRTSALYGVAGRNTRRGNFVETMLRLGKQGGLVKVVSDQVMRPTYARDLAETVRQLVDMGATGTFHVTNGGCCSWYEFACEIFRVAGQHVEVRPISHAEWPMPGRRPPYSVLARAGLQRLGLPDPRPWPEALEAYVRERAVA